MGRAESTGRRFRDLRPCFVGGGKLEDNYWLFARFDNGELINPVYFKAVKVDGFIVVWSNGQDICPDE